MAGVDYGAIVKIDGKIVNWGVDLFPAMRDVVGFSIDEVDVSYSIGGMYVESYRPIDRYYYYYMGDASFLVAVYKDFVTILIDGKIEDEFGHLRLNVDEDGSLHLIGGVLAIEMERIDYSPRLFTRFAYNGHSYEILHGYLVSNADTEWVYDQVDEADREPVIEWLRDGGIDA